MKGVGSISPKKHEQRDNDCRRIEVEPLNENDSMN